MTVIFTGRVLEFPPNVWDDVVAFALYWVSQIPLIFCQHLFKMLILSGVNSKINNLDGLLKQVSLIRFSCFSCVVYQLLFILRIYKNKGLVLFHFVK